MIDSKASGDQNEQENVAAPQVQPAANAVIQATVANGDLEAYLYLEPPTNGGAAPTLEAMKSALLSKGISHYIDQIKLYQLAAEPVYLEQILVAKGIAPINGNDGMATFQVGTEKKTLKPREREDGTVDYRDLDIVENVTQGQVLCVITPPTEGTTGISVKGNILLAKKGRPVPSLLGKNTEFNADGSAILSRIDGQIEFDGKRIHVNETFIVKENVDNSTGNLNVLGNLFVPGMVLPGFQLEAGGSITVSTRAEGSMLKAGTNISIYGGIINCDIYSEGDLRCRFIENCNVYVKGDVRTEYIINSNVRSGKSIKISGNVAKIIGGICIAGESIVAHTIGSPSFVQTRLEIGTDYTILERQQNYLAQIRELEKQNKSLTPLISLLLQLQSNNRLTPDKKQALDNAVHTYDTNINIIKEARAGLDEIAEAVRTKGSGRVVCTGILYPGTKVVIAEASMDIRDSLSNATLYYSQGAIQIGVAGRRY